MCAYTHDIYVNSFEVVGNCRLNAKNYIRQKIHNSYPFKMAKRSIIMGEREIQKTFDNSTDTQSGWNIQSFTKKLEVVFFKENKDQTELEFDLIGCSAAFANAIRRILLSEVPSMAIEKVHIHNNTSIMQDEVLAHRLGLIPLKADPRLFDMPPNPVSDKVQDYSDMDTIKFELRVKCTKKQNASKDSVQPDDMYENSNVKSGHFKWVPIDRQETQYPNGDQVLGVLDKDILIVKMRPGHEIALDMYAVKGIGQDHAKFSPVATASYRLLPEIEITKPITGERAERFKKCFSPGVIEIIENDEGEAEAVVKNARYDSCSRNVFYHEDLKDCVQLKRKMDHFIFTVESVGALPSTELVIEALKVLKNKCTYFLDEIENSRS